MSHWLSGYATLKCCTQLWLLKAAQDDTSLMLTQINAFNSFLAQVTSSSSKRPCCLIHDWANKATQICAAKAYMTEFSNKCACSKAIEKNTNPQVSVLSSGAGQRPVKTKTDREGTFVWKRKQKKAAVNKNMHVGLGRQLKETKAILAEEDVPIDCSALCTQELPENIFQRLFFLLLWV